MARIVSTLQAPHSSQFHETQVRRLAAPPSIKGVKKVDASDANPDSSDTSSSQACVCKACKGNVSLQGLGRRDTLPSAANIFEILIVGRLLRLHSMPKLATKNCSRTSIFLKKIKTWLVPEKKNPQWPVPLPPRGFCFSAKI